MSTYNDNITATVLKYSLISEPDAASSNQIKPNVNWVYGPWNSILEFKDNFNKRNLIKNNFPLGTTIGIITNEGTIQEYWKCSLQNEGEEFVLKNTLNEDTFLKNYIRQVTVFKIVPKDDTIIPSAPKSKYFPFEGEGNDGWSTQTTEYKVNETKVWISIGFINKYGKIVTATDADALNGDWSKPILLSGAGSDALLNQNPESSHRFEIGNSYITVPVDENNYVTLRALIESLRLSIQIFNDDYPISLKDSFITWQSTVNSYPFGFTQENFPFDFIIDTSSNEEDKVAIFSLRLKEDSGKNLDDKILFTEKVMFPLLFKVNKLDKSFGVIVSPKAQTYTYHLKITPAYLHAGSVSEIGTLGMSVKKISSNGVESIVNENLVYKIFDEHNTALTDYLPVQATVDITDCKDTIFNDYQTGDIFTVILYTHKSENLYIEEDREFFTLYKKDQIYITANDTISCDLTPNNLYLSKNYFGDNINEKFKTILNNKIVKLNVRKSGVQLPIEDAYIDSIDNSTDGSYEVEFIDNSTEFKIKKVKFDCTIPVNIKYKTSDDKINLLTLPFSIQQIPLENSYDFSFAPDIIYIDLNNLPITNILYSITEYNSVGESIYYNQNNYDSEKLSKFRIVFDNGKNTENGRIVLEINNTFKFDLQNILLLPNSQILFYLEYKNDNNEWITVSFDYLFCLTMPKDGESNYKLDIKPDLLWFDDDTYGENLRRNTQTKFELYKGSKKINPDNFKLKYRFGSNNKYWLLGSINNNDITNFIPFSNDFIPFTTDLTTCLSCDETPEYTDTNNSVSDYIIWSIYDENNNIITSATLNINVLDVNDGEVYLISLNKSSIILNSDQKYDNTSPNILSVNKLIKYNSNSSEPIELECDDNGYYQDNDKQFGLYLIYNDNYNIDLNNRLKFNTALSTNPHIDLSSSIDRNIVINKCSVILCNKEVAIPFAEKELSLSIKGEKGESSIGEKYSIIFGNDISYIDDDTSVSTINDSDGVFTTLSIYKEGIAISDETFKYKLSADFHNNDIFTIKNWTGYSKSQSTAKEEIILNLKEGVNLKDYVNRDITITFKAEFVDLDNDQVNIEILRDWKVRIANFSNGEMYFLSVSPELVTINPNTYIPIVNGELSSIDLTFQAYSYKDGLSYPLTWHNLSNLSGKAYLRLEGAYNTSDGIEFETLIDDLNQRTRSIEFDPNAPIRKYSISNVKSGDHVYLYYRALLFINFGGTSFIVSQQTIDINYNFASYTILLENSNVILDDDFDNSDIKTATENTFTVTLGETTIPYYDEDENIIDNEYLNSKPDVYWTYSSWTISNPKYIFKHDSKSENYYVLLKEGETLLIDDKCEVEVKIKISNNIYKFKQSILIADYSNGVGYKLNLSPNVIDIKLDLSGNTTGWFFDTDNNDYDFSQIQYTIQEYDGEDITNIGTYNLCDRNYKVLSPEEKEDYQIKVYTDKNRENSVNTLEMYNGSFHQYIVELQHKYNGKWYIVDVETISFNKTGYIDYDFIINPIVIDTDETGIVYSNIEREIPYILTKDNLIVNPKEIKAENCEYIKWENNILKLSINKGTNVSDLNNVKFIAKVSGQNDTENSIITNSSFVINKLGTSVTFNIETDIETLRSSYSYGTPVIETKIVKVTSIKQVIDGKAQELQLNSLGESPIRIKGSDQVVSYDVNDECFKIYVTEVNKPLTIEYYLGGNVRGSKTLNWETVVLPNNLFTGTASNFSFDLFSNFTDYSKNQGLLNNHNINDYYLTSTSDLGVYLKYRTNPQSKLTFNSVYILLYKISEFIYKKRNIENINTSYTISFDLSISDALFVQHLEGLTYRTSGLNNLEIYVSGVKQTLTGLNATGDTFTTNLPISMSAELTNSNNVYLVFVNLHKFTEINLTNIKVTYTVPNSGITTVTYSELTNSNSNKITITNIVGVQTINDLKIDRLLAGRFSGVNLLPISMIQNQDWLINANDNLKLTLSFTVNSINQYPTDVNKSTSIRPYLRVGTTNYYFSPAKSYDLNNNTVEYSTTFSLSDIPSASVTNTLNWELIFTNLYSDLKKEIFFITFENISYVEYFNITNVKLEIGENKTPYSLSEEEANKTFSCITRQFRKLVAGDYYYNCSESSPLQQGTDTNYYIDYFLDYVGNGDYKVYRRKLDNGDFKAKCLTNITTFSIDSEDDAYNTEKSRWEKIDILKEAFFNEITAITGNIQTLSGGSINILSNETNEVIAGLQAPTKYDSKVFWAGENRNTPNFAVFGNGDVSLSGNVTATSFETNVASTNDEEPLNIYLHNGAIEFKTSKDPLELPKAIFLMRDGKFQLGLLNDNSLEKELYWIDFTTGTFKKEGSNYRLFKLINKQYTTSAITYYLNNNIEIPAGSWFGDVISGTNGHQLYIDDKGQVYEADNLKNYIKFTGYIREKIDFKTVLCDYNHTILHNDVINNTTSKNIHRSVIGGVSSYKYKIEYYNDGALINSWITDSRYWKPYILELRIVSSNYNQYTSSSLFETKLAYVLSTKEYKEGVFENNASINIYLPKNEYEIYLDRTIPNGLISYYYDATIKS